MCFSILGVICVPTESLKMFKNIFKGFIDRNLIFNTPQNDNEPDRIIYQ